MQKTMKSIIKVSKREILGKLKTIARIIRPVRTIPSSGWFRFRAEDRRVVVSAADADGEMSTAIETIEVIGDADFCVDSNIFLNALSELSDHPITISFSGGSIDVNYLEGSFVLPTYPPEDFPMLFIGGDPVEIEVEGETLHEGISTVVGSAGNDELRPIMNSVFMEAKEGVLTFVSTNSTVLSVRSFSDKDLTEFEVIIPVRAAKAMAYLIAAPMVGANTVKLFLYDKRVVRMSCGCYDLSYRLTEGRYPNYRSVIPQNTKVITMDPSELVSALRRVSVFSESQFSTVVLEMTKDNLVLTSGDSALRKSAKETIEVSSDFEMRIGFNSRSLIELLLSLPAGPCRIAFSEPVRPVVITPEDGSVRLELIQMPVLISE